MDRTNKPPSNGDAGSNKARNPWHKAFGLIKSQSKQELGETEIYDKDGKRVLTAREQLEVLASAKVGEELIGKNKNDLGLGFDKYLGFATTHIEIEGIKANNLRVFTKDGKYYITTKE